MTITNKMIQAAKQARFRAMCLYAYDGTLAGKERVDDLTIRDMLEAAEKVRVDSEPGDCACLTNCGDVPEADDKPGAICKGLPR